SDEASREDRAEATDMIRRHVARLATMINEVLDFTRQTPGAVALTPTGFHDFVRVLLGELRPVAGDRAVNIVCENPPPEARIAMDERRLVQAFYNLINNAADFMPGGGTVTLRFASGEKEMHIEVEDSGPGIAPEIAGQLFHPFATFGKKTGTGLGLSICKRIIESHKGRIRACSELGRGAIFAITLPLAD
ncbi:MAG: HAMP domain-containing sensor histidine kinase, partial [Chthoniobacteraceae bacterium]